MTIRLVVLTGPIGAGKSTVAELVARRVGASERTAAIADLDDVAFAQRGRLALDDLWRRAGIVHALLVRAWFAAEVDVVVAHGPFFESRSYEQLYAAVPSNASLLHVLLHVSFEAALARVEADPGRGAGAVSRDPAFLRATHDAFGHRAFPPFDIEIDTTQLGADAVAERIMATISGAQPRD